MRHITSPFHTLSDDALRIIAHAVEALPQNRPREVNIEIHNFLVDVRSELEHRGTSYTQYVIPSDNSDLLS